MIKKPVQYIFPIMFLLMIVLIAPALAKAQGGTLHQRKNIEDLSAAELDRYRNAVRKLKGSGKYAEFAKLHNGSGTSLPYCQHRNELFFPWHRSLLYAFEKALQEIDPDVTIPYWKWTEAPRTGRRYPIAFEGDASNPLWFNRTRTDSEPPEYDENRIKQVIKDNPQWNAFAGSKINTPPSYGNLEHPFHNSTHNWCGQPMSNPRTAAQNPIFWSFHAYIDFIWDRWQKQWPDEPIGSLDSDLRNLTEKNKVRDVVDIENQLNYTYVASPDFLPAPLNARLGARGRLQERVAQDTISLKAIKPKRESGPFIYKITVPEPDFSTAHIHIADIELPRTISYSGAVYLYPSTVNFNPTDAAFKQKYFVDKLSIWVEPGEGGGHESHEDKVNLYINATTEFRYLAKTQPKTQWNIAIVIDPPGIPNARELEIQPANQRLPLSKEVKFGDVSISLDHFIKH